MWKLVRSAAGLLHWWWGCDRIRASPSEGRLLRLLPPCYLRIADEPAEVVSRQVKQDAGALVIVYGCKSAVGDFEVLVRLTNGGPQVRVRRRGHELYLAAGDVEVISGAACS